MLHPPECYSLSPVSPQDRELLEKANSFPGYHDYRELTAAVLREITVAHGLDFATALAYQRAWSSDRTQQLVSDLLCAPFELEEDVLFALVPGAFYRTHRNTGADASAIAQTISAMGGRSELVPLHEFGRVEQNSNILASWLKKRNSQKIALVSLSKGSAEVAYTLSRASDAGHFSNVIAWVSLSGIWRGCGLVNWLKGHLLRTWGVKLLLWMRGQSFAAAEDLLLGPGTLLGSLSLSTPSFRAIHVHGYPLQRHLIHPYAPRGYRRVAPLGPNDAGGVLLGNLGSLPGVLLPLWGVDHYLTSLWRSDDLLRNLLVVASWSQFSPAGEIRKAAQQASGY